MSTAAKLYRMHPADASPRAGAFCSDGLRVDTGWHFHDMHQLMYAFEGAVELDSPRGHHLVPRQLAAWIPAGVMHRTCLHSVRSGSVFFPTSMITGAGDRVRTIFVSTLMREMLREAMRWPIGEPDSPARTAYFAAMSHLCVEWIEQEAHLVLPTSNDPRVKRALDCTAADPTARIASISSQVGMSERSLRRHVRVETGMTWESYRRRTRLLRAIALLSDTDIAVGEIAASCGFESQSAFAKAFREAMRETPREYRSRVRT